MTRSTRLFIVLGLALALVGGAAYAAVQVTRDRVDEAIPQVDLFGPSEEPSPSPSPSASPTPRPGRTSRAR
ncbi:hypothetical protein ACFQZ4_35510 [Catellatospora coxensis]